MKKVIDLAAGTVTFKFDGELEPVVVHGAKLSPTMKEYASLFGIGHRCGDNAAIQKSKENNYTVTEAMRREAVVEMADHMQAGGDDWDMKPSARRAPRDPFVQQIADKHGITYEQAQAKIQEMFLSELA